MVCFTDNMYVINDYLELDKNFKNIYPSELQFRRKNLQLLKHYDLAIIIENKNLRLSSVLTEMHPLFLLFVSHI